jgi:hypothetical protein
MEPSAKLTPDQVKAELNTKPTSTKRQPPTSEQILAQQRAQAAEKAAKADKTGMVPAKVASTAVAAPDSRTDVQRYLDDIAPASIVGRLIKFSKEGQFITADDGEPVDADAEYIVLADETLRRDALFV